MRKEGKVLTRILKLGGRWQADENNRLRFLVKKEERKVDVLTLQGIWELNRNHEITYRYEKMDLKTKERLERTVIFKGFWEIRRFIRTQARGFLRLRKREMESGIEAGLKIPW